MQLRDWQQRIIDAAVVQACTPTKVSGYLPIAKSCSDCHYVSHDKTECSNKVVAKDPEVPRASSGLKKISPRGWCNEWEKQ
jgi:hypothetical protein